MKTLIVCVSVSHGNTKKVADALAGALHATVVEPHQMEPTELGEYDLIGFGSGIYGMAFHRRLYEYIRHIPSGHGQRAFVYATRGGPGFTARLYVPILERLLRAKGFEVVGSFTCRGFDTWLPLRLIGGLNKGRPDNADLQRARAWAATLVPTKTEPKAEPKTAPKAAPKTAPKAAPKAARTGRRRAPATH